MVGLRMKKVSLDVCCCGFGQTSPTVGRIQRPYQGITKGTDSDGVHCMAKQQNANNKLAERRYMMVLSNSRRKLNQVVLRSNL